MTDTEMHPSVRKSWKSLRDPKTVCNSPRNGQELAKIVSVDDGHVNAPQESSIMEIALSSKNDE